MENEGYETEGAWRDRMHRALDCVMDRMNSAAAQDVEGFNAGGTFHPIRGGEGYKPGKVGERRRWKRSRK